MRVSDHGAIRHARPQRVAAPRTTEELCAELARLNAGRTPVAIRGGGNSTFGQTLVDGGVILDLSRLTRVELSDGGVRAQAGATWRSVAEATARAGGLPPVLPDYLDLTVGGTLSVGGFGGSSHRLDPQTDHVRRLTVATLAGDLVACDRTHRRDLFDAVRGALGLVAVVVEAEIERHDTPYAIAVQRRPCTDAEDLLAQLDAENAAGSRHLVGHVWFPEPDRGPQFGIRSAEPMAADGPTTVTALDFARRLDPVVAAWKAGSAWAGPHAWCDVLIGREHAHAFLTKVLHELRPHELGAVGAINVYPLKRGGFETPGVARPANRDGYLIDVLRCTPGLAGRRLDRVLDQNRSWFAHARELGGRLYPVSAVPMSQDDWHAHWGPRQLERIRRAKAACDPHWLLGSTAVSIAPG